MDGHHGAVMDQGDGTEHPGLHAAFVHMLDAMEEAGHATGLFAQDATLALSLRDGHVSVALIAHGVSSAPINPLAYGSAHARLPWHRHTPLLQAAGLRLMDALARHPVWSFLADGCVLHFHAAPSPDFEPALLLAHGDLVLAQGRWRNGPIERTPFLALWRALEDDRPDGVERMLRHRDLGGRPVAKGPFSIGAARRLRAVLEAPAFPSDPARAARSAMEGDHPTAPSRAPYAILEKVLDAQQGVHPRGVHAHIPTLPTRVPRAVAAAYTRLLALRPTLPASLVEAELEGGVGPDLPTGRYTVVRPHDACLHLMGDGEPGGAHPEAKACYAALTGLRDAFHRFIHACTQASPCLAGIWAQRPPLLTFRPHTSAPNARGGASPTQELLPVLCGLPIAHKAALAPFFADVAKQRPYHVFVSPDTSRLVPAPSPRRALAAVAAHTAHTPPSVWADVEDGHA